MKRSIIFWIMYLQDLTLNGISVDITVLLLLKNYFSFVMIESSCYLFLTIIKLMLLKRSTLLKNMYLSITNGVILSTNYDIRGDFNFEIVTFPFLDGDVI